VTTTLLPAGPEAGPAARARGRARARRRYRLRVLLFLAPWLVGVGLFLVYPLLATVYFSFTRYDLLTNPVWVGLRNWDFLLHKDPHVWQAFGNTLWLVLVMVPLRVLFGLGVAGVLIRIRSGAGLFRTLFYLPYLVPPVAGTLAFVFLLNPGTGPVNDALRGVGIDGPAWFNDPHWAKPALVLLSLWGIGDLMVIFLASLLDVPAELYEAAALDGAGGWQRFRYVTLPAMTPVLVFAAVTGVITSLQYFTQAMVAARVASGVTDAPGTQIPPGYPDFSTLTLPQWLFEQGFRQYNIGYACVLALVMFAVALAFTALLLRRSAGLLGDEA
jgi:multiple sugar transport system permease protein